MASKRAAKKAAPPPPPAESSDDETRSGSRSRSDDSEDEEAIADSPVPAHTPAPKNTAAPSLKGGESESSEGDDDEDDEEEEPVRAPPKNQPPPPQNKEDSDTSGSEEEEEEEEPAPKKQPPPPAPKNQPPPAPEKSEESDGSDDDEEEEDEEEPTRDAPPAAPKKDLKPPAAAETKKPGAFQRIWSTGDDVRILEALAAHQKEHGALPQPEALMDVLAGKLDNPAYGSKELQIKVRSLRTRYLTLSKRGEVPSKEHDRRILDLSKIVWDSNKTTPTAAAAEAIAVNGHEHKGFEEMCELYPYLAEEVKGLEAAHPGMCKREFGKMDDDKARAMDEKIKRQRVLQIKLEMRRADLTKEVTKALCDLVDR
ncbi:hypothetical protein ACQ4PT_015779 [Festuca glaucescens]